MQRPASALPSEVTVRPEPYGDEGPRWVVAQAEAELVTRYGGLDAGERGLTAAMFDPPTGAFLVARRRRRRTTRRRGRPARPGPQDR